MKKIFMMMFGIFFMSGYSYANVPNISLEPPTLEDVMEEEDDFDLQKAIEGFKEAIKENPDDYVLYDMLAVACDYAGDYVCELNTIQQQVKVIPEDYENKYIVYGNLGRAYMLNEQWEEGKEWIDKADAINPDNHYNRANAFSYYILYKKDFQAAALELKEIQRLLPEQDAYYKIYRRTKDHEFVSMDDFIAVFKAAIERDPDNYRAYRLLGVVYRDSMLDFEEEMNDQVLENLKKALELNSEYIPTYISLAGQYFKMAEVQDDEKYFEDVFHYLNKAKEVDPENLDVSSVLGLYFFYVKDYKKAIESFEFVFDRGGDDGSVKGYLATCYNNLAYEYYLAGEHLNEGLKLINKAIEFVPDQAILLGTKAELLYKKGEYEKAHDYIKQALALEPQHEEMQQDLINIETALARDRKRK